MIYIMTSYRTSDPILMINVPSPLSISIILFLLLPLCSSENVEVAGVPPAKIELLYCKGQNLLLMLLETAQVDGYVAWQPCPAQAEVGEMGKIVNFSQDFPPNGFWHNHPCCAIVAKDALLEDQISLLTSLCAMNMLSTQWVNDNPDQSIDITSEWLMGGGNYTFGDQSMPSTEVFKNSFSSSVFSCRPDENWIKSAKVLVLYMNDLLNTMEGINASGYEDSNFFDLRPYTNALKMINGSEPAIPNPVKYKLRIGYLMSDHLAPLFVAIKEWKYFQDEYGMALKPKDEEAMRPREIEFIVNGEVVAEIELSTASTGQTLMTLIEQNCLDMAYVGIPPALGAIGLGCKAKIILPIQNQGSALVFPLDSPVNSWDDFVSLARSRSIQGKPLRIADPDLGTIADAIFQSALKAEGIECVKAM
jgi:ABC-type nitrate/sulfonate/bicarbonate transport system substrate-binding protein